MNRPRLPRVAVIGTGGTIASVGEHSLELTEYINHNRLYDIHELLGRTPELEQVAEIVPIPYATLQSPAIGPVEWLELNEAIHNVAGNERLDGIVLTHGTATLEETAYFLNLALHISQTVVLVGAQRPATGLSGDGPLNLVNAVRVAGSPEAAGLGVVVVMNDEILAAREATKTSTLRLQTFRAPDFGVLGHADPDAVAVYRRPTRRRQPDTEFFLRGKRELPRVDIVMSYAGADGAMVRAAVASGAKGVVVAGFAPGLITPDQRAALDECAAAGIPVVQSSRAGSGRVPSLEVAQAKGSISADNLTPQKARILLMLALAQAVPLEELSRVFATY